MAQTIIARGTLSGKNITMNWTEQSATDDAAAVAAILPPPVDLSSVLNAIAALKLDLDASVAAIEAKIGSGTGGGGTPGPWTKFPATGPDAAWMPYYSPAVTATSIGTELPNGTFIGSPTTLTAGTFHGVIDLTSDTTVTGAGIGQTILDITTLRPIYRKAVVVCEASTTPGGATASNMTLTGAAIAASDGQNAAGICNGAQGYNMTIDTVEIYGCQQGIRSLGGNVTVKNTHIHHCGEDSQNTGDTHGWYLSTQNGSPDGTDTSLVTITSTTSEKSILAHEFKSRLGNHTITNSVFASLVIPGSAGSYVTGSATQLGGNGSCLDVCNGGTVNGTGNLWIKGLGAVDRNFITYGTEGPVYPGKVWTENNLTLVNSTGRDCYFVIEAGLTVILNNPTIIGPDPILSGAGTLTINNATRLPAGSSYTLPPGAPPLTPSS